MRRYSPLSNSSGCASQSSIIDAASLPQNFSPPTSSVGTPNTPAAIASSVFARSRSFTLLSAIAFSASPTPSARATSASSAAVVPVRPSRQR